MVPKFALVALFTIVSCCLSVEAVCKERKAPKQFSNQLTVSNGIYLNRAAYNKIGLFMGPRWQGTPFPFGEQQSISYQRGIAKSIGIVAQYTMWSYRSSEWGYVVFPITSGGQPGTVTKRSGYQQVDLLFSYLHPLSRKHSISLSAGPSYAFGWDMVVPSITSNTEYSRDPRYYFQGGVRQANSCWGLAAMFRYDYAINRGRYSIGINLSARAYQGFPQPMYFGGPHASVHF